MRRMFQTLAPNVMLFCLLVSLFAGCSDGGGSGGNPAEGGVQWRQDHLVVDAEYDRSHDLIVTVSDAPYQLRVIDPNTRSVSSVNLSLAPHCVSVRPDGLYAAVGHTGFISYVNLTTMTVEEVYSVSCDVFDIVLPSNGWVYSVPREDQWERMRCTRLDTGAETLQTGGSIRAGTKVKLHPSGNYIYGADNGLSPSDIEKYDIRPGTAVQMYDSPYHGDFDFSGDLWISDDGLRVFAKSGNVFRASEVQAQDLIFNGELSDETAIQWMDTSSAENLVYVVPTAPDYDEPVPGVVHLYSYEFLVLNGVVELPGFSIPDGVGGVTEYGAQGAYVFADSSGRTFHALYRAEPDAGLLFDWAIATYDIDGGFRFGEQVPATLAVSAQALEFQCGTDARSVNLSNVGTETLQWAAAASDPRIVLSTQAGTLLPGAAENLLVSVDWTAGSATPTTAEIVLTTDSNQTETIVVNLLSSDACSNIQWRQDHIVIDAEYDKNRDVIVTVSDGPARLHVLDPNARTRESVDLPLTPHCVSIRPDGMYAAVGHTGFISYVNLVTMTVEEVYGVTCDVSDIVLPANGWVYSLPLGRTRWDNVRCTNLATGAETESTGGLIVEGAVAKLHPSGDYFYVADRGISPSDFEKYDIRAGTAVQMYDSPYHGDFAFSGDIWISDDGLRLFARSGNVFRSSAVQAQDMIFNGRLSDDSTIKSADTATADGIVYVVPMPMDYDDPAPGNVHVYSYDYLVLDFVVTLPGYTVSDGVGGETEYDAEGAFVFADSTGTKFHALYNAVPEAGLQYDWAVATYDLDSGFQTGEPTPPSLILSEQNLIFQCSTEAHTIMMSNIGKTELEWQAAATDPRIGLSSTSGTILPGASLDLLIDIDWTAGSATSNPSEIVFTTSLPETKSITVRALGTGTCSDDQWSLDHLVIDAEYTRVTDRIVTVSDAPFRLYVLDPEARTSTSVDLSLAPNCVSIRPDGAYAAVGHDGFISYVNLNTMTVEQVYPVTCDVFDIVLPSSGWVYAMPRVDQWEQVRCIPLSTGIETLSTGGVIRAGTKMKLHPSGDYIYGANNGLSPSDIEKYDIQGGTAVLLYDSPYHGDFDFAGDLWITDDGARIFARSGNVFTTSDIRAQDMLYAGSLSNDSTISWMDTSSASGGYLFVVPTQIDFDTTPPGQINIFRTDFLNQEFTVELPPFTVPDGMGGTTEYPASGAFVFADSTEPKFHALYRADPESGVLLDWVVSTYDIPN